MIKQPNALLASCMYQTNKWEKVPNNYAKDQSNLQDDLINSKP